MILEFKQKLCQNGLPIIDLQGEGYSDWDCFDGMIEYQIDFDVREHGIKDIIPSVTSLRVHLEEMDGDKTKTIDIGSVKWAYGVRDVDSNEYTESWTQLGDAISNGLHISHIVLNLDNRIIDVCLR